MSIKTWSNLFSRNPRTRQIFGPQIPAPIVFLVFFALIIGGVYLITVSLDKLDGEEESDEFICPEPTACPSCSESVQASDSAYAALQEENQKLQEALKEAEAEQEKLVQELQGCVTEDGAKETTS